MQAKLFWRRLFAYFADLLILGAVVTLIALAYNSAFSTRILAPELLSSSACMTSTDLVSEEKMNELFPLENGQAHLQVLCKQTNMFATTFYTLTLQKTWSEGNRSYSVYTSYPADENGNYRFYVDSEPFFYILAPLVFALFLAKWGQTPGKALFNLAVYRDTREKPSLKDALKREYLKGSVFVLASLVGFYDLYTTSTFDLSGQAQLATSLFEKMLQPDFLMLWLGGAALIALAVFWFLFGSFIRWKGRSYWDRFAHLNTGLSKDFSKPTES
ncbi:RDD family protein [Flexibacterium corallicola]|uniref:RDD family protein n=1 Tax=Flexibacterium corallicola TaxID=3037259 RepID=UPI00286F89B1|nr:RDD family protein [Pseudovibrio sp. M1P-2-3]